MAERLAQQLQSTLCSPSVLERLSCCHQQQHSSSTIAAAVATAQGRLESSARWILLKFCQNGYCYGPIGLGLGQLGMCTRLRQGSYLSHRVLSSRIQSVPGIQLRDQMQQQFCSCKQAEQRPLWLPQN